MSFDLHFAPCRYDGTSEKRRNPFTGQLQDFPRNEALSDAEAGAVLTALEKAGAKRGEDDYFDFQSADGASAEVYASGLEEGCMFAIRGAGVTPQLARLLFEVMVAGNWVVVGGEDFVIAPNDTCTKNPPNDFGRIVVASSPEEVMTLLCDGFDAWRAFRDRAAGTR